MSFNKNKKAKTKDRHFPRNKTLEYFPGNVSGNVAKIGKVCNCDKLKTIFFSNKHTF